MILSLVEMTLYPVETVAGGPSIKCRQLPVLWCLMWSMLIRTSLTPVPLASVFPCVGFSLGQRFAHTTMPRAIFGQGVGRPGHSFSFFRSHFGSRHWSTWIQFLVFVSSTRQPRPVVDVLLTQCSRKVIHS